MHCTSEPNVPQLDRDQVYGRRSLDQVLQSRALVNPEAVFAHVVCAVTPIDIKAVTYSNLSNAISQAAWLIQRCIGKEDPLDQTLWYTGCSDLRYLVFALAACRVGHKTVFISPKNTPEAHTRLLRATNCRHVFTSDQDAALSELAGSANLRIHTFPSLNAVMWAEQAVPFTSSPIFDEIADRPCMILHTSGSTNHPKPVVWTHRNIAAIDSFHNLPEVGGERAPSLEHHPRNVLFLGYPLFHAAGLNQIMYCIFFGSVPVFAPGFIPLSVSLLETMIDTKILTSAALPPAIIEDAARDTVVFEKLPALDYIVTSGAPLTKQVGDRLCNLTRLIDLVGSTECNSIPELRLHKSPEDWTYHCFHPSLGIEFRHHLDDTFEAVFVRSKEYKQFQAAFVTFPDLSEYPTSDLYSKHPTRSNLWRYRGRKDNLIVLTNGEKFQPDEVEALLSQEPEIGTALLAGQGRFEPAAILIPTKTHESSLNEDRVQSLLQLANEHLPSHAQLAPTHVRVLERDTALPRSLKGKLQRDKATKLLEREIDDLYQRAESDSTSSQISLDDASDLEDAIHDILSSLKPDFRHVSAEDNLFSHGMDSLTATRLWRRLKAGSEGSLEANSVRLVYDKPSIRQLAAALTRSSHGGCIEPDSRLEIEAMRDAITTFADLLPLTAVEPTKKSQGLKTVILTGSTGSLGCYVLDSLMRSPESIGAIHCFNRSTDSASRQMELHRRRGLRCDFSHRNVSFHTPDLSQHKFGLVQDDDDKAYNMLLNTVDCIIHLAWPVNWSAPFASFAPHLRGCSNLIAFSSASPRRPRIIFASSVGVANNPLTSATPVPEARLAHLEAADPTGYARSKLVAEHIFHQASRSPLSIPITICRIGQIAGATSGRDWSNTQEWFPSMVAASASMRVLPRSLASMDQVDWVPVDVVAEAVTGLALSQAQAADDEHARATGATYAHLVNPARTSWSEYLLPSALHALKDTVTRTAPLEEWVSTLEARVQEDVSMEESSAGRLLDFYKRLARQEDAHPVFKTAETCQMCPAIKSLGAIQPEWLESWIADWHAAAPQTAVKRRN